MNKKRQREIEGIAIDFLVERGYYTLPPIKVIELAISANIKTLPFAFENDISGILIVGDNQITIGYAANNRPTRQRFTIAHELGHLILGHQRKGMFVDTADKYFSVFYRDDKSTTGEFLQEREANAFAASLLMPEELLRSSIDDIRRTVNLKNEDVDVIKILSDKFEVGTQAMAFRLANLGMSW